MLNRSVFMFLCLAALCANSALSQSWVSLSGPSVAVAPKDISSTSNGVTVFMADNCFILKSTDSGVSWKGAPGEYDEPEVVQVNLSNGSIVVAAKDGGLVRATDAGASWSQKIQEEDLVPLVLFNVINDNGFFLLGTEYVSGKSPVRISTNSGNTWTAANFPYEDGTPDIRDFASYPQTGHDRDGVVWACGSDHNGAENGTDPDAEALDRGVWLSPNFGADWYGNQLGDFNLRSIAVAPAASKWTDYVVIVVVQDDQNGDYLKRSQYSGNGPWNDVSLSPAPSHIYRIRRNRSDGYLYLATDMGVFRSTNGGTSFSQVNNGLGSDLDVKEVEAQNVAGLLYAATTEGGYKTTDSGANWSFVSYMDASTVASGSTVWSASRGNALVGWTTDAGSNWSRSSLDYSGANAEAEHAFRVPGNSHYLVAGKGAHGAALFRSTTAGGTCDDYYCPSNSDDGRFYRLSVDLTASNNYIYLCGGTHLLDNNNTVWRNQFYSPDNGATWYARGAIVGSGSDYVVDYVVINSSTRYAVLLNGQILQSTDGGDNWSNHLSAPGSGAGYSLAIAPGSTSIIYAGRSDGLWKYSGGWSHVITSAAVKRVVMHAGYHSSSDYLFILEESGGSSAVRKSTDGGTSFTSISSGLPKVNDIECNPTSGYLYAATEKGIYRYDIQPAPPKNLAGSGSAGQHPQISWDANIEVDVAGYTVYRRVCGNQNYDSLASVGAGQTSYTDESWNVGNSPEYGLTRYVVRAYDAGGNLSIESGSVGFACQNGFQWKAAAGSVSELPIVLALHDPYPNPFNPITVLQFDLPEPGTVSLAVYDLLGRKVADLASGYHQAGYYPIVWNAADMASGVYLARFNVVNELGNTVYTKTNKLVLMK